MKKFNNFIIVKTMSGLLVKNYKGHDSTTPSYATLVFKSFQKIKLFSLQL